MLETAAAAGAAVHQETQVTAVDASARGVTVTARSGSRTARYACRLVVGADGVNSLVARSQGLLVHDPRRSAVARRAYARMETAEACGQQTDVFFSESIGPGYGWIFPVAHDRVNLGVGVLSETQRRTGMRVPELFESFVEQLRRHDPACANVELDSRPIGGVVKTYGGAGRNHFDGGVLVGDAGCFVDPMTGEGITPGMESALFAAQALLSALETGDFSASSLRAYEAAFRAYFDRPMLFLDLCSQMLRNRHLARPLLNVLVRGCQLAQEDGGFARVAGSYFGGLELEPTAILGEVWWRSVQEVLLAWPRLAAAPAAGRRPSATSPLDLLEWQRALARSLLSDPRWHLRWTLDLQRQWVRFSAALRHPDEQVQARAQLASLIAS
jgi:flavin-dependent dehydrogenase